MLGDLGVNSGSEDASRLLQRLQESHLTHGKGDKRNTSLEGGGVGARERQV